MKMHTIVQRIIADKMVNDETLLFYLSIQIIRLKAML
jgi:hypothetical protein